LKRAEEELRELSGRLIRSQEEAARGLARELHDTVAQRLALLGLGLASPRKRCAMP
jgi:signal transduction histidine kinase